MFCPQPQRKRRWWLSWLRSIAVGFALAFLLASLWRFLQAYQYANDPIDAVLVLGGSIKRELYISQYARSNPDIPILISSGSKPPCIYLIFQRDNAPMENIWLENCARSTFENFYYSLPVLERWGVRKVLLVTSLSHLPRSMWLAQIVLGSHGLWVEPNIVPEIGVPGNREFPLKTILDVARSLFWAFVSQVYSPSCDREVRLDTVNLETWQARGFQCEHQAQIESDN
ncbi:MAG: YdcF family protein [Cyanobacteria bacterium SID2]|nr:YdcF family protein [Cyanobacteria bacterium SID2]MBP0005575.1 YdcF family protein [Cyanobacteria bacterium SBC]